MAGDTDSIHKQVLQFGLVTMDENITAWLARAAGAFGKLRNNLWRKHDVSL